MPNDAMVSPDPEDGRYAPPPEEGAGDDESAAPPLSRSLSFKDKSMKSMKDLGSHLDEHKHKYGAGCACITVTTVILVVVFVVILVTALTTGDETISASDIVSGKLASKVSTATMIPSKGASSSRRRKLETETELGNVVKAKKSSRRRQPLTLTNVLPGSKPNPYTAHLSNFNPNLRRLALSTDPTVASEISEFSELSDYSLTVDPTSSVHEEAAGPLDLINTIGCSISQIRIFEVGLNTSCNPGRLPFTTLINDNLCDSTTSTFSEWFIVSVDGPTGGDGEYSTQLILNWQSSGMFVSVNHKAIISGGVKTYDGIDFSIDTGSTDGNGDPILMNGVMVLEFDDATKDASVLWTQQTGGSTDDYLYATYNSESFTGAAISGDSSTTHKVKISENYILKEATDVSSGSITETCIDFSEDAQVLTDSAYLLFSAMDGSKLAHQSGFPVEMTVPGYDTTLMAFIDYWGLYVNSYVDDTGAMEDYSTTSAHWVDGATVSPLVDDGSGLTYTLRNVDARLERISKQSVSLSDVVGLPLTINNYGSDYEGYVIYWNGTDFIKKGEKKYFCVDYSADDGDSKLTMNFEPTYWSDCYCVDSSGNLITSGSFDYNQQVYRSSYTAVASEEIFPISSSDFSRGIEVKAGELYGQVALSYEVIQNLYFGTRGSYTKGQTVTQGSVSGTVAETTASRLYGVEWSSGTDAGIDYTTAGDDCGRSGGYTFNGPYLYAGMKLTQASTGATALLSDDVWWLGEGIPITDLGTGTWETDASKTISISIPTDWDSEMSNWIVAAAFASGEGLKFGTTSSLSQTWPDVEVVNGVGCSVDAGGNTAYGTFTVTGTTSGTVDYWIDLSDSNDPRYYAWISNAGSGCTQGSLAVDVTGLTCATQPVFTVNCNLRIESSAQSVKVKLADTSAAFSTSNTPWKNDNPVTIANTAVGTPGWSHKEIGDVVKASGTTTIDYRIRSLVVPGETIPELACYNNCPKLSTSPSHLSSCSMGQNCYEDTVNSITGFQVDNGGECSDTSSLTLTTSGAGALTAIGSLTLSWTSEVNENSVTTYYLDSVEFAAGSNGANCSTDSMTLNLGGSGCTTYPSISAWCDHDLDAAIVSGGSVASQLSTLYTFDSTVGYLTDKATGNTQDAGPSNDNYDFGPFFENIVSNYDALVCDWNDDVLCPYKVYEELTTYYEYRSGRYSNRALLEDSDGNNVVVDAPKLLSYTHSGTDSNSGTSYDGAKFLLEYTGSGDESIAGLPKYCLNAAGVAADCDPFETTELQDINIPTTGTLVSIDSATSGYLYYALPSAQVEYYPAAASSSNCSALTYDILTLPDFDTRYTAVELRSKPTTAEMEANYALGGSPLSIGGEALFEIDGTDGECRISA